MRAVGSIEGSNMVSEAKPDPEKPRKSRWHQREPDTKKPRRRA